jgi:hypothetical protein
MQRANPVATPLDPNVLLEPNPDGNEGDRSNSYTHILGELQFLANVWKGSQLTADIMAMKGWPGGPKRTVGSVGM